MKGVLVHGAVAGVWGKIYPVVNGRLRRHPGLSDPTTMSEDDEGRGRRYGVLLVWLVEAEDGRTLRKCGRCFQEGVDNCPEKGSSALVPLLLSQMMASFTLLLLIPVGIVQTPDLRNECAQIRVGWVVLPGSPVGRPLELASQSTHPSVSIRVHDSTTTHNLSCALRGTMLVEMAMGLGRGGGEESGKGEKD